MATEADILKSPKYQEVLEWRLERHKELWRESFDEEYIFTPSDPIYKVYEIEALRECIRREQDNYDKSQVYLTDAINNNLDARGEARRIYRNEESDADYRERILSDYDGFSTSGSRSGYVYHGRYFPLPEKFKNADIVDVYPFKKLESLSGADGKPTDVVTIYVIVTLRFNMSVEDKTELFELVKNNLLSNEVKPLGSETVVELSEVSHYKLSAVVYVNRTEKSVEVTNAIKEKFFEYQKFMHKANEKFDSDALKSVFYIPGIVRKINLEIKNEDDEVVSNIEVGEKEATWFSLNFKNDFEILEQRRVDDI